MYNKYGKQGEYTTGYRQEQRFTSAGQGAASAIVFCAILCLVGFGAIVVVLLH